MAKPRRSLAVGPLPRKLEVIKWMLIVLKTILFALKREAYWFLLRKALNVLQPREDFTLVGEFFLSICLFQNLK